jgi:glycosyltransferase involved in cell wall biosynthesis
VEIVVVDDASTEETAQICRGLSGIRYVRADRNQKLGRARNLGILASTGEYISFLDDDDLRLPDSLDVQIKALESAPDAGFVYGQALIGDQNCAPTGDLYPRSCPQGDIFWELLAQNFIPCPSSVFRRSCLYRVGLMGEGMHGIEDWDLWLRIAELYPVIAVERPVAVWRRSTVASGQITSRSTEMIIQSTRQFRRRWLTLPRAAGAPARMRREARRRFSENAAKHLIWEARRALAGVHLSQALENAFMALRLHPLGVARAATRGATFRFLLTAISGRSRA